ncbi:hypothetical protein GAC71_07275, partial [Bacteroides thetaiotaomicron]
LSANSVMRGRLDARRTLKSLVADLRIKKQLYTTICLVNRKKTVRLKGTVFFLNLVLRRLLFPDFILFRFDPDFVSDSS